MNEDDFRFKLTELYRVVHLLKMQEGVCYYTHLYDELDAAEEHLFKAITHINQFKHE